MIETNVEVSKDLEKALQALQQAKQRVANEKKRKAEGGRIVGMQLRIAFLCLSNSFIFLSYAL